MCLPAGLICGQCSVVCSKWSNESRLPGVVTRFFQVITGVVQQVRKSSNGDQSSLSTAARASTSRETSAA